MLRLLSTLPVMQWKLTTTQPLDNVTDVPAGILYDFSLVDDVVTTQHTQTNVPVPTWHMLTSLHGTSPMDDDQKATPSNNNNSHGTHSQTTTAQQHTHAQHGELAALYEWLGALAIGVPPHPPDIVHSTPCTVTSIRADGLWTSDHVHAVLQRARVAVASGALPWCAVSARGPPHAPVSWTGTCCSAVSVHSVGMVGGGENELTMFLLPEDVWLLFAASGEGDHLNKLW